MAIDKDTEIKLLKGKISEQKLEITRLEALVKKQVENLVLQRKEIAKKLPPKWQKKVPYRKWSK